MARWDFPNVFSGSWVAVFAPGKTPDAVVTKLNAEINAGMKEPDALEKLKQSGFDPLVKNLGGAERLFQERGRELGQDGQRRRLLELTHWTAHRRAHIGASITRLAP